MTWVGARVPEFYLQTPYPQCLHDGIALCALMESLVTGACPRFDVLDSEQKLRNLKLALHLVTKHLNIKPEISAEEILATDKSSEKTLFILLSHIKMASEKQNLLQSPYVAKLLEHNSNQDFDTPQTCLARGMGLLLAVQSRKSCFSVLVESTEFLDMVVEIRGPLNSFCSKRIASARALEKGDVRMIGEVVDGSSKVEIPLAFHILGRKVCVGYTPLESGKHHLSIIWHGQHVKGSPYVITVDKSIDILDQDICSPLKPPITDFLSTSIRIDNKHTSGNSGIPSDDVKKKGRIVRKKVLRYIVKIGGNDVVIDDTDNLCEIINSLKTQSVSQDSESRPWNTGENDNRLPERSKGIEDQFIGVFPTNGEVKSKQLQEISSNVRDQSDSSSHFDKSTVKNKIIPKENTNIPLMSENIFSAEILNDRVGHQNLNIIKVSVEQQKDEDKNKNVSLALQSCIQENVDNSCLISIDKKDLKGPQFQKSELKLKTSTSLINNNSFIRKIDSTDFCRESNNDLNESLESNEVLPYIEQIIDIAKIRSEKSFLTEYENSKNPNRNSNVDDEKHSLSLVVNNNNSNFAIGTDEYSNVVLSENLDFKNGCYEFTGKEYTKNAEGQSANSITAAFYKTNFIDKNFPLKNAIIAQTIDSLDLNDKNDFNNKEKQYNKTRNITSKPVDNIRNTQKQHMPNLNCELWKTTAVNAIDNPTDKHLSNFNSLEHNDDDSVNFNVETFRTNISLFRCDHSFPCYDESEPDLYASGVDTRFQSGKIQSYPEDDPVISLLQKTKDSLDSLLTTSDNIILRNSKSGDGFNGVFSESYRVPSPNSQCDSGNDDSIIHSPEIEEMTFEVHRNVDDRNDLHGQGKRISWSDKCWLPCIRESSIESLADAEDIVRESKTRGCSAEGLEPSHDIPKQKSVYKIMNKEKEMVEEQCPVNMSNTSQHKYSTKNVSDTDPVGLKIDSDCVLSFHGISKDNILNTNAANYENQIISHQSNVPMTKIKADGGVNFSINSYKDLAFQSQHGKYNRCSSKFEDGTYKGDSNIQTMSDRRGSFECPLNSVKSFVSKAENDLDNKCNASKVEYSSIATNASTNTSMGLLCASPYKSKSIGGKVHLSSTLDHNNKDNIDSKRGTTLGMYYQPPFSELLANSKRHLEEGNFDDLKMANYDHIESPENEHKTVECPSVKKVMKIFQQEPIDKYPGIEKNFSISPSRTRKAFIEDLLDCPGKSDSQSGEVFDSFKNENQSKVASIKDRVKIFDNENPSHISEQVCGNAYEKSNNSNELLSTVLDKRRYWENIS